MDLAEPTAALKAKLDARPGVTFVFGLSNGRVKTPTSVRYKLMDKMFAILSLRGEPFVILKCDPHLAETLREQYAGVGHRSHLDSRFWISVTLDADVPPQEVDRLVAHSYDLVRAGLTRKQQAQLTALGA